MTNPQEAYDYYTSKERQNDPDNLADMHPSEAMPPCPVTRRKNPIADRAARGTYVLSEVVAEIDRLQWLADKGDAWHKSYLMVKASLSSIQTPDKTLQASVDALSDVLRTTQRERDDNQREIDRLRRLLAWNRAHFAGQRDHDPLTPSVRERHTPQDD